MAILLFIVVTVWLTATPEIKSLILPTVVTVVSRVSAHGRSTITPRFSVYWALTQDTGRLPCVIIETGGADCVGVATTKHVHVEHGMHAGSSSI